MIDRIIFNSYDVDEGSTFDLDLNDIVADIRELKELVRLVEMRVGIIEIRLGKVETARALEKGGVL